MWIRIHMLQKQCDTSTKTRCGQFIGKVSHVETKETNERPEPRKKSGQ